MATIFIDYENVCMSAGLKGVKYLDADDKLIIFYSKDCEKIRKEYLDDILESKCKFEIVKLVQKGKNALDFYIATKVGMEIQSGERFILIVSRDKGFAAVQDFITSSFLQNEFGRVAISSNIENGLLLLNDPDDKDRRYRITKKLSRCDLAVEFARIEARKEIYEKITNALKNTKYEDSVEEIISFVENGAMTKKKVYTRALHEFGRKEGTELYRIVKDAI